MKMNLENIISQTDEKTVYLDGDKTIKVYNGNVSKSSIFLSAANQSFLEESGLSVSPVLSVQKTDDGKWAVISRYISGASFQELLDENNEHFDQIFDKFVDVQLDMHSRQSPLLPSLRSRLTQSILKSDIPATTRYALIERMNSLPKQRFICHGTFLPRNVIHSDDSKSYILDWSNGVQGNVTADVAMTYILFKLEKKDDLAEKYLSVYKSKSSIDDGQFIKWVSVVAAGMLEKYSNDKKEILYTMIDIL